MRDDADVVNTDSEYEFEFDPNENINEIEKQTKSPLPTRGHRKKRKGLSDDDDDDFDPNQKKKAPLYTRGHRKKGLSNDSDTYDDFDQIPEHGNEGQKKKKAKLANNESTSTLARRTSPRKLTPRQFGDPYVDHEKIDIDAASLDEGMVCPSRLEQRPRGSPQGLAHLRQFQKHVLDFETETGITLGQARGQETPALSPFQIPTLPPFQCRGLEELSVVLPRGHQHRFNFNILELVTMSTLLIALIHQLRRSTMKWDLSILAWTMTTIVHLLMKSLQTT